MEQRAMPTVTYETYGIVEHLKYLSSFQTTGDGMTAAQYEILKHSHLSGVLG